MDYFTSNDTISDSNYEDGLDHCKVAINGRLSLLVASVLLIYSIIVFVLYSLLQRRKTLCQDCCFGGYCGLPVPINFIHETKDRWVYCAAFGMLVNLFTVVVINVSAESTSSLSSALSATFKLFITMMLLPLYFFALIGSIHGPLEPLSHLIGLIYAILSFLGYMRPCAICIHYANNEPRGIEFLGTITAFQIVSCAPLLLCNGIVILYFAVKGTYVLILRILRKPLPKQENIDHCLGYVRRLFRSSHTGSTNSFINCYKWDPYFKYSVRVLSVFTVILIVLFVWSVQVAFQTVNCLRLIKYLINVQKLVKIRWTDVLENIYKVFLVIGFIVPLVSFALIIIPLIISLTTYRRNCKQLWRGDRSFIPRIKRQSPTVLLTSSAFLFGRQLAMAIWAWIFYIITLFTVIILLAVLITSVIFVNVVKSIILNIIYSLLITFGVSTAIYFSEMLFVYFVFADRSVLVNNRRLFHLYTYFFLFYNSVSGLATTLRRILTSFVVPLLFLPRLDRPLVIRGLEFLDKGYASYLAYIQVEAAYTNPVLNVFIHLLMTQIEVKVPRMATIHASSPPEITTPLVNPANCLDNAVVNKMARRRWYLMYTLVRNPEIVKLRKGYVPLTNNTGDNAVAGTASVAKTV